MGKETCNVSLRRPDPSYFSPVSDPVDWEFRKTVS